MFSKVDVKTITIVTPCFNEEENVEQCYLATKDLFKNITNYHYEHIFIDNASTDKTVEILKSIAKDDKNVKIILNSRNFGHIKSPFYALLQSTGDATILFVADMQDPIDTVYEFINAWEQGYKSVVGVKKTSKESSLMFAIRKLYYKSVNNLSEIELIDNFTGFGLYDKEVVGILRNIKDPYPYFRGMIAEIGLSIKKVEYDQPARQRGITKKMIDLTLEYGKVKGDKIRLGTRRIKELLRTKSELKSELLKLMDKGGLVVVFSGATLITAYAWR